MRQHIEDQERVIVFPSVNLQIREQVTLTFRAMEKRRKTVRAGSDEPCEKRRCNRCGNLFGIDDTVLMRYHSYSRRKHRLCRTCSELYVNKIFVSEY